MSSDSLIRPPLQRRSRQSLERVLQAGLEVLIEVGFEGFTLQEVSRRAKVSIGSIYARAPSREALLLAIHERAMESMTAQEHQLERGSAREGLTPRQFVETLVGDFATIMLVNRAMLRVFMNHAPINERIWARGARNSQNTARLFREALEPYRHELRQPDPDVAIDIAYRMVYSTVRQRVTHGPRFESDLEVDDVRLVQELGRAVADYLL